jgi:hypothetical protein
MIRNARRDFQDLGGLPDDQFFADPFVSSGNVETATTTMTDAGKIK